jgi:hypothetical protein
MSCARVYGSLIDALDIFGRITLAHPGLEGLGESEHEPTFNDQEHFSSATTIDHQVDSLQQRR